ncbi:MAG: alpha/beta hydrolase [Armatimonadetes bacterium]|nr:alpha/beta hydrolase [Armatimonadota bacterium]
MAGFLVTLALVLLTVYIIMLVAVTYVSVHPPRVPIWLSPSMLGFPEEDVSVEVDGNVLTGWWSDCGDSGVVIVCCHGYLMNRCELMPLMITLADLRASWVFFDFRCHGRSGGKTCTMGKNEAHDVAAIVAWVREKRPDARIVLFGSSMGGAAATIALGEDPGLADALVLDGAFSSMDEAGRGWWNFIGGKWLAFVLAPTVWLGGFFLGFNPAKVVIADYLKKASHRPVLFLVGDDDPIVSAASAERNIEASGPDTYVERFESTGHGQARFKHPEQYYRAVREFVRTAVMQGDVASGP